MPTDWSRCTTDPLADTKDASDSVTSKRYGREFRVVKVIPTDDLEKLKVIESSGEEYIITRKLFEQDFFEL